MVVVHDLSNKAYTQEWYDHSKSEFEKLGGSLIAEGFKPGSHINFPRLANRILEVGPDGVLLVASCQMPGQDLPHAGTGLFRGYPTHKKAAFRAAIFF